MPSSVELCNMALSHLGVTRRITGLTQASEEARVCNLFYEPIRDEVLEAAPWPFATKSESLALVTDMTDDEDAEWGYSYRVPSDCLRFGRIRSGFGRKETNATQVRYRIVSDTTGQLIYTDQEDAIGEYVWRVTDTTRFAPAFVTAFTYRLAMAIAPAITAGDPNRLGLRAAQFYEVAINQAKAHAFNQASEDVTEDSGFLSARNGTSSDTSWERSR